MAGNGNAKINLFINSADIRETMDQMKAVMAVCSKWRLVAEKLGLQNAIPVIMDKIRKRPDRALLEVGRYKR